VTYIGAVSVLSGHKEMCAKMSKSFMYIANRTDPIALYIL